MNARFKKIASSIASLLTTGALALGMGAADATAQMFEYTYGGEQCIEAGRGGVQPVRDGGGYVAVGETFSPSDCETSDIYIVRTHNDGSRAWSISYDLGGNDSATDIQEVLYDPEGNGGFIITGVTEQLRQERCRPSRDVFLLRIDRCGFVIWMKTYGHESSDEIGWDLVEAQTGDPEYKTAPGDFIVAGSSTIKSNCRHGYLLRVRFNGDLIWDAIYSTGRDDYFYALDECLSNIEKRTGDIVAAGGTHGYSASYDAWVVRVDGNNGQFTAPLHNAVAYGREGFEEFRSVQELKYSERHIGDLVFTGRTTSGLRNSEVYLLQTTADPCRPVGDETMGDLGSFPDEGYCIRELPFEVGDFKRGYLVVTGYVSALEEMGGHGGKDLFVQLYEPVWNQVGPFTMVYGGQGTDWGWSVAPVEKEECRSAGFIVAGFTNSPDLVEAWDPQQLYLIKTNERLDDNCTAREFPVQEWSPKFEPNCKKPKVGKILQECRVEPELRCQYWERQICLKMDVPFCEVERCECGQGGRNIERDERGDAGASEKLSGSAAVTTTATTSFAVRSFPNPVKRGHDLKVEYMLPGRSEVTITITDMAGKVVHTIVTSSDAGARVAAVNTKEWASGSYMVSVTAEGKSMTRRVVVTD